MKTTPLHASHAALGAKMGEFAGYDMPLYYAAGVLKEHEWTRAHTGLFDVSHMGQVTLEGPGALALIERLTPSVFGKLEIGRAKYSVLTNERGGCVDDLIITRCGDQAYFLVLNAGCKDKDIAWIKSHLTDDVSMKIHDDFALIALQGQDTETVLREALGVDITDMPYMSMETFGSMYVSRLGYTGEDGVEISVPAAEVVAVWDKLIAHASVKPVGLAARDSLRLEMGYPLYGHELAEDISPVEAGLNWIIGKDRDGYIGADVVRGQLADGIARVRVGVRLTGKGIARENSEMRDAHDKPVGVMSSGGFSPTLKQAVGMAYVPPALATLGQEIFVNVRGNNIAAVVCAMPFVPARTKSMKKKAAA